MALSVTALLTGSLFAQTPEPPAPGTAAAAKEKKMDAKVYSCSKCHMEAKAAGTCPMCGEEMKALHKMKAADGKTYVCECAADCPANCTMKEGDMTQCSCGKPAHEAKWMKDAGAKAGGATGAGDGAGKKME
jgi:hypothetical protein